MKYNHESYLPIGAFQPILGRMRLHGGGGNPLDNFSDMIGTGGGDTGLLNMLDEGAQGASDVFAGADDLIFQPITAPISQVTSALDDAVVQPITAPISEVGVAIDDAVADVIPGGWGTLAQVAAAIATMGQSLPIQAAAAAAASAGSDYAKNKDVKSATEKGAVSGATRYGLGTLGEMMNAPAEIGLDPDLGMPGEVSGPPIFNPEGAVTSLVPEPTVQNTPFGPNVYPDAPPPISGEIQMTDTGEFINRNPNLQNVSDITSKGYDANAAIKDQANLDNKYTFAGEDKLKNILNDPTGYATEKAGDVKDYLANKALVTERYLTNTPLSEMPGDLYDAAKDYYNNASKTDLAMLAAGAYGLSSLGGGGGNNKGKSQAQIDAEEAAAKKVYTYGTAGQSSPNYLLKNRINADNVYSSATGYRPLTRYAEGGEVQHYGIGGKISDAFTRVAQPFEKAVIRPIGEAAPFLKDLAPYAGMAAGAMMGNPAMAAGVGGIVSGFGKPGGFDFKRAFMGGVASYGMSNFMGGLEAAGTPELTPTIVDQPLPIAPDAMGYSPDQIPFSNETGMQNLIKSQSEKYANAPPPSNFRNPEAIQKGIGNLLQNSNTPAYKDAMAALTNKVGIYNTGVPLMMGTTGMMGVDESNAMKKEYDVATAKNQEDADKFAARTAAGKKRAQQAVSQNPYMFAEGGAINPPDDQTQLANETPMQNLNQQAQMQMASPLQGLGLGAENQMMAQSAGIGNTLNSVASNNGVNGLFSQLTSNPSNNATPYTPQGGTPESVILPSYGGSGGTNMAGSGGSSGGGTPAAGSGGAFPLQGQYGIVKMAAGGMPPRFLSGGGDGMSDSIRANIDGAQEARLADGEFVIPADVVSHLGNGSSKAGATQLYAMMDRVRKARTGNPKQGREIKPTKLMPV